MKKPLFPLIGLLKKPSLAVTFMLLAGGLFALNYYVMANLPGHRDLMCVIGAGLTPSNLLFALSMSLLAGFVVIGMIQQFQSKMAGQSVRLGSAATAGVLIGGLTTFCTLCTLPVISLFGLGINLGFITDYETPFKLLSLVLLGGAFYLLNRQLRQDCLLCQH